MTPASVVSSRCDSRVSVATVPPLRNERPAEPPGYASPTVLICTSESMADDFSATWPAIAAGKSIIPTGPPGPGCT